MFAKRFLSVLALVLCGGLMESAACAASPNDPLEPRDGVTKIACVGDSITHGSGASRGNSYPDQLQRMLGNTFVVKNFGVSGATLLNKGDKPYQKEKLHDAALKFDADVVVIMLGTNDSKEQNWKFKDDFSADYADLIGQFAKLDSKPRIWIARPCPVAGAGNYKINEENVSAELPLIDAIAKQAGTGEIDVHGAMAGQPALFGDRVHPTTEGATVLAKTVYAALMGKTYDGPSTVVTPPPIIVKPAETQGAGK